MADEIEDLFRQRLAVIRATLRTGSVRIGRGQSCNDTRRKVVTGSRHWLAHSLLVSSPLPPPATQQAASS